jgi:hypothetical protein
LYQNLLSGTNIGPYLRLGPYGTNTNAGGAVAGPLGERSSEAAICGSRAAAGAHLLAGRLPPEAPPHAQPMPGRHLSRHSERRWTEELRVQDTMLMLEDMGRGWSAIND